MDLSSAVVKTLKGVASADSPIDNAALKEIVAWTLRELATGVHAGAPAVVAEGGDVGVLAASLHSAVGVVFLEAAKGNLEEQEVVDVLEGACGWRDAGRIGILTGQWGATLPAIRARLQQLKLAHPHVTGCSWSAHHQLGDREVDPVTKSQPKFFLNLDLSDASTVNLALSGEQLQVLEEKLRDMLHETNRAHDS